MVLKKLVESILSYRKSFVSEELWKNRIAHVKVNCEHNAKRLLASIFT